MSNQPGIYQGKLPPSVAFGRCTLKVGYASFDTTDDQDNEPEYRIPKSAKLLLAPNLSGSVLVDDIVMGVTSVTLYSTNGVFDFYAIDPSHSTVIPSDWSWRATLTVDDELWARFTFTPDSTKTTDLGPLAVITTVPRPTADEDLQDVVDHILSLKEGPAGPAPKVTWDGTRIVVEGTPGPDLKGPTGPPPAITWNGTKIVVGGTQGPDLAGPMPNFKVGNTTTGTAQVVQRGTQAEPILDFTVPAGGATPDYVQAREANLVTNGFGSLGNNTNFPGSVFDASQFVAGGGSFRITKTQIYSDEPIPVDPTQPYLVECYWKRYPGTAAGAAYAGIAPIDVDKKGMSVWHYTKVQGSSDTTLAKDLNPGDTTMTLADATGWSQNTKAGSLHYNNITWWPYVSTTGYVFDNYTYSRNSSANTHDYLTNGLWNTTFSGTVITLRKPWDGAKLPAGTPIRNSCSGSNYKYFAMPSANETWTKSALMLTGVDVAANNSGQKLPPGTSFIRLNLISNGADTLFNGISVRKFPVLSQSSLIAPIYFTATRPEDAMQAPLGLMTSDENYFYVLTKVGWKRIPLTAF